MLGTILGCSFSPSYYLAIKTISTSAPLSLSLMHTPFLTISRTNRTDSGEVLGDDLGLSDPYYCHAHSLYGGRQDQGLFPLSLYTSSLQVRVSLNMNVSLSTNLHIPKGKAYTTSQKQTTVRHYFFRKFP